MWIESHQSLRDHPKLIRAARRLKITRPQLIGHLHCLWWWALDYAQDGDLSAYAVEDIADAADWTGDAADFVGALAETARIGDRPGFLEKQESGAFLIHDWYDYAGKLLDKRAIDAARKRASRRQDSSDASAGHPQDIQAPVPVTAQVPNLTVPNLTNQPNQPELGANTTPPSTPTAATPPPLDFDAPEKKPRKQTPNGEPDLHHALFGKVAEMCGMDTSHLTRQAASQIAGAAKQLAQAGATVEGLDRFGAWWRRVDWRGKKGQTPTPPQVVIEWPKFSANGSKSGNSVLDRMIEEGLWQPGQPLSQS